MRWVCYILDAIDRMGRNVQGWDGKGVGVMCLTGVNGVDRVRLGFCVWIEGTGAALYSTGLGSTVQRWDGKGVSVMCLTGVSSVDRAGQGGVEGAGEWSGNES